MTPELARWARDVVIQAWRAETGRDPSLFEAQCVQALTWYESRWGRAWEGACAPSHNWGAVQATSSAPIACEYSDTYPDGTRYPARFRVYADDVSGCRDAIRLMLRAAGAELAAAESTDDVWRALYYGHYYGAHCPEATQAYGQAAARESFAMLGTPATSEAGRACEAECIRQGQDLAARVIAEIAQALGEEPSPRGAADAGGDSSVGALLVGGVVLLLLVHAGRR